METAVDECGPCWVFAVDLVADWLVRIIAIVLVQALCLPECRTRIEHQLL